MALKAIAKRELTLQQSLQIYAETYPSVHARLLALADHLKKDLDDIGLDVVIVEKTAAAKLAQFRLTPAERRLAEHIVSGQKLKDIARAQRLSVHTLRNQLQSVFSKTGVSRQIDLVRKFGAGGT